MKKEKKEKVKVVKPEKVKKRIRLSIQWKMVLVGLAVVAVFMGLLLGYFLPGMQSSLLAEEQSKAKENVQIALTIINNAYNQEKGLLFTENDAQALAIQELSALRYGDNNEGYFWITDTEPRMINNPVMTDLNGKYLSNYKDPNGKAVFVDMVDVCKANGEGFVTYLWPYGTDANRNEQEISYLKAFDPWGWIVGTGFYTVDINGVITAKRNQYLIIGSILAVVCAFFVFWFSRVIARNVKKAANIANKLATGDVDQKVQIKSGDETGEMGESLGKVVAYLQEMSGASERIANGDLGVVVTPKSEKDTLSKSFSRMISNLKTSLEEIRRQVFLNIVLNAEQAMIEAHGGGNLTITTEQPNDIIKISFSDDGPGIPQDIINRVFDPFFTTKEVGKGTGLGLSICYGIVTKQGGRIYAQSQPGKGATFVVELPINVR